MVADAQPRSILGEKALRDSVHAESEFARRLGPLILLLQLLGLPANAQVSLEEPPSARVRSKILGGLQECVRDNAYVRGVSFDDLGSRLAQSEPRLADAESAGEFARRVNDVLAGYGVSHLMLYDPALTSLAQRGSEVGAGFRAMPLDGGGRLVTLVLPEGPAAKLGLLAGDVITRVDGESVAYDPSDLFPFSRGGRLLPAASSSRGLQWTRGGSELSGELRYGRHRRSLRLELRWEGDVAWLVLNSFQDYDTQAVEEVFREIESRNARGLILDLRSNGGGRESYHLHLASMMIPAETPVFRSIRRGEESVSRVPKPETQLAPYAGPLVILVNGINGSAGEIFPAYMRQVRKATLIGSLTNGAVLGGIYCQLNKGYRALVPIKEVLPLDGRRIEGRGVEPDVQLTPEQTTDAAVLLEKSLAALESN
ncbi:MAG: S41 family peptidase [Acidobacteriota bacterium]